MAYCRFCGNFVPEGSECQCRRQNAPYSAQEDSPTVYADSDQFAPGRGDYRQDNSQQQGYAQQNAYQQQDYSQQNAYQQQDYSQQNAYQQQDYSQQSAYQQPDYSQQNAYQQPDYSQQSAYQQPDYSQQSAYQQPEYNYDPGYQYDDGGASAKKRKLGFFVIGGAALVIIAVITAIIFSMFFSYKRPIKKAVKGFNKNDIEMMYESVFPPKYMKDLKDSDEWDDMVDDSESEFEDMKEEFEDVLGDDVKLSVDFVSKKKMKKSECKKVQEYYNEFIKEVNEEGKIDADWDDVKIEKGYRVKVKLTLKGDDDKKSVKTTMFVVKIKGCSGWYATPFFEEIGEEGWEIFMKKLEEKFDD